MTDIIPWRFVLFALVFAVLLYLQFYLAHRQWKRLKGDQASEIDVGYVRTEDYLAQSFRMKVREWLQLPSADCGDGERTIWNGRETIRVAPRLELGSQEQSDDVLVVEGDFSCGSECTFRREIYVQGNARVGAGSRLQSMAVEGDLVLEHSVRVARWLDSAGELTMGAECQVGARVTSLNLVRLGQSVQVESVYAPQVCTAGWNGMFLEEESPQSERLPEIAFSEEPSEPKDCLVAAGFEPDRLAQLPPDCWAYKGDVRPTVPVRLKTALVVKGSCYLAEGSIVDRDLKATGSLYIGPFSTCKGNLIADGDIYLGRGSQFRGLIHAMGSVLISQGSRGGRGDAMVAAYARQNVCVESDVVVKGKLAAGGSVTVVSPVSAEAWRVRRGIREDSAGCTLARV